MKSTLAASFLATLAVSLAAAPASADVSLPSVISSGMVLQQSASVPIWGWADPGEEIAVTPSWTKQPVTVRAGDDGSWRVLIQTPAASSNAFTLSVKGSTTITLSDILVGEVWLCSGQSNMEWPLAATDDAEKAITAATHPRIRLFTVKNTVAATPQRDSEGRWKVCTPETARSFSAVGYYFGSALQAELNVPIGLIAPDWGGTPAEAWTSAESIGAFPEFADHLATNERLRAKERGRPSSTAGEDAAFAAWLKHLNEADLGSRDPAIDPRGGWYAESFDDSGWGTIDLIGSWQGDLASFDGFVWMRAVLDVPDSFDDAALAGATLRLGAIDDCDTIWINGSRAAQSMTAGVHATPRTYPIAPGLLRRGRNVIAIRVLDTGGPGGISGDANSCRVVSKTAGGASVELALPSPWRAMKGAANSSLPRRPQPLQPEPWRASNLYNGMIAPIAGFGIRGAIWYQGESNVSRAFQYRTLFPAMITDWRTQWAIARGDRAPAEKDMFPFYFVQIAPFAYDGDAGQAAELREAQTRTLALANTGMAVTMDIGNPADIHPRNKKDVGRRLALWALAKTYSRDRIEYSGPIYKSMRVQNNRVFLSFDHVGKGLMKGDGKAGESLTHFTITGDDQKFISAQATIEGDEVVVWHNELLKPVAVRFAWGAADQPNLKNKAGLPAPSFRTDDWPMLTQPKEMPTPKPGATAPAFRLQNGRSLVLQAPIERWDEAIPLGNGLLGGLVWGKGNLINLSLDRGDLWDLRTPDTLKQPNWTYETMKKLVAAKDHAKLVELFDAPYDTVPYPTKLPGGRLVIHLDDAADAKSFALDLRAAEATVDTAAGTRHSSIKAFFSAIEPVGYMTYTGPKPRLEIIRPKGLDQLGYAPAQIEREGAVSENRWFQTMKQVTLSTGNDGKPFTYVVAAAVEHDPATRRNTIVTTITSSNDSANPIDLAGERLERALAVGYDAARAGHNVWWEQFWKTSSVSVPDESIQAHYDLCKYFYGSASRASLGTPSLREGNVPKDFGTSSLPKPSQTLGTPLGERGYADAPLGERGYADAPLGERGYADAPLGERGYAIPPIPLQGVWTADEGGLPPWKGDFHNDLNTQMTYLAYHTAGLEEAGRCWLDFNMKLLPRYQRFAKEFYGVDGAVVPGVMTLTGDPMGGWGMYSLSPTNGAWVAQSFYLHWKYTQDQTFLRERAWPFIDSIKSALRCLLVTADPAATGSNLRLALPLSSSPEIHDNSLRAWLVPNSNYDQSLIRWTYAALTDMSRSLDTGRDPIRLMLTAESLSTNELDIESSGSLTFAKNEPYTESHRHFSHTMAIHPLMLLTIDGPADEKRIVNASIDRILEKGTSAWTGYSFSWMSCILATIARPEQSLDHLEKYMRGFILRNGFHCNGDQSGTGLSNFTYRPFTLEGNFLAMQAVQDMLIQSWGGRLRIFPAVSMKWADASFTDLRAEGGFKVSAERVNGRTKRISVTATVDSTLRLRDPFPTVGTRKPAVAWNRDDASLIEGDYFLKMKAGETLEGTAAD